jgi:hypothetical protein
MSYVHLIFGLLLFVVFTITGRYMRADFPDKGEIDQAFRILMRSRHIYILISSLIHIGLGAYLQIRPQAWRKALQYTGSALLFLSSVLLVRAFVIETYALHGFSNISRYGLYASLAGIILHFFGGALPRERTR